MEGKLEPGMEGAGLDGSTQYLSKLGLSSDRQAFITREIRCNKGLSCCCCRCYCCLIVHKE